MTIENITTQHQLRKIVSYLIYRGFNFSVDNLPNTWNVTIPDADYSMIDLEEFD